MNNYDSIKLDLINVITDIANECGLDTVVEDMVITNSNELFSNKEFQYKFFEMVCDLRDRL